MAAVLDRELHTYEEHRAELLSRAEGKFVLIHDGELGGVYDTDTEAVTQGYQRFGIVPFLVRKIASHDEELTPIVLTVLSA